MIVRSHNKAVSPIIGTVLLIGLTVGVVTLSSFIIYDISDDVGELSNAKVDILDDNKIQLTDKENADKVIVRENNTEYELSTGEIYEPQYKNYSIIAIKNNEETLIRSITHTESTDEQCNKNDLGELLNNMDGDGTNENPYKITNVCELQSMDEDKSSNYILVTNINASETSEWNEGDGFIPIANPYDSKFTGSFNGQNYEIYNLHINRSEPETNIVEGDTWNNTVGLFSEAEDSSLQNVYLSDVNITSNGETAGLVGRTWNTEVKNIRVTGNIKSTENAWAGGVIGNVRGYGKDISDLNTDVHVTGENRVGGVVGEISNGMTRIHSRGTIKGTDAVGGVVGYVNNDGDDGGGLKDIWSDAGVTGDNNIGGIAGRINSNEISYIENSYSHGKIIAKNRHGGGIVGLSNSQEPIINSHSTGNISGGYKLGGVVGFTTGNINHSTSTSNVESDDENRAVVGGLVGATFTNDVVIFNSSATGDVKSKRDSTGGLIGFLRNNGQVSQSYATGDVINNDERIGGLIGRTEENVKINNSYATGNVYGNEKVGGLIGWYMSGGIVEESYATGDVSASKNTVGGLVGLQENNGTVRNSYAQGDVISNDGEGEVAGGLIGASLDDASIEYVYSTGLVDADGNNVGGLIGFSEHDVKSTYWDTVSSNQDSGIGSGPDTDVTGLVTDEMQGYETKNNMNEFDFDTTWNIVVNPDNYPILQW